jgi:thiol-disulfide isomerase/thioredoxin
MQRIVIGVAALAVTVLVIIGLTELGGGPTPTPASTLTLAQMREQLQGAPPALASLHAQASEVLPGGLPALRTRLASLRGRPIVVNKWASWCPPCRSEFGAFQRVSLSLGRRVAFLGIDSGDESRSSALAFLREHPVSYPSYFDPSGEAGQAITDSSDTPVTVFIEPDGSTFIHQGPYLTVAKLERDVERYALGA